MLNIYVNAITLISSVFCSLASANTVINATAKWDTTAVKSTKSTLVANPSHHILNFSYSPNTQDFNTVKSDYDLAVFIPIGITDTVFKTKIMSNSLTRNNDNSSLDVGVQWNGEKLSKTTEVILEATQQNRSNLFTFNIESANVQNKSVQFKDLSNGLWSGDVSLGFTAYWIN